MSGTSTLPPLREVIASYNLETRKSLGQNFLLDLNLTGKIARTAGDLTQTDVVETGPGPGGLTRALLSHGARRVIAIERDPRFLPALADISAACPGRLEVIEGDALKTDMGRVGVNPVMIVANLPYNIATPLLVQWMQSEPWPPFFKSLTLMFQKEVAERITATPGQKAYGRLSILTQWRARAEKIFDVDRRNFTPVPNVDSSVVRITPLPAPLAPADPATLERIVKAAFGQRRKMIRSSLKALGMDTSVLIREAGLDPAARAEHLSITDFCRLAQVFDQKKVDP